MSAGMPIRSRTPIRKSVARSAMSLAVAFWLTSDLFSQYSAALAAPLPALAAAAARAALAARGRRPHLVVRLLALVLLLGVRHLGDHPLGLLRLGRHPRLRHHPRVRRRPH